MVQTSRPDGRIRIRAKFVKRDMIKIIIYLTKIIIFDGAISTGIVF